MLLARIGARYEIATGLKNQRDRAGAVHVQNHFAALYVSRVLTIRLGSLKV